MDYQLVLVSTYAEWVRVPEDDAEEHLSLP